MTASSMFAIFSLHIHGPLLINLYWKNIYNFTTWPGEECSLFDKLIHAACISDLSILNFDNFTKFVYGTVFDTKNIKIAHYVTFLFKIMNPLQYSLDKLTQKCDMRFQGSMVTVEDFSYAGNKWKLKIQVRENKS